jgi:hypothetical protein
MFMSESAQEMQKALNIVKSFDTEFEMKSNFDISHLVAMNCSPTNIRYNNTIIYPVPPNTRVRLLGAVFNCAESLEPSIKHAFEVVNDACTLLKQKRISIPRLVSFFKSVIFPAAAYPLQFIFPDSATICKINLKCRATVRRALKLHRHTLGALFH